MRRFCLLTSAALSGAFTLGCADRPDPTGPAEPAISFAVTLNQRVPFTTFYDNPCNGELIEFHGFLHNLSRETPDGSGGFHIGMHYNLTVRGVGESGARYVGTEAQTVVVNAQPPFPFTQTVTLHTNVLGRGAAPDFRQHVTFHVTVNANGDVTTIVDKFRSSCRGA
jgi:hypothetical protein